MGSDISFLTRPAAHREEEEGGGGVLLEGLDGLGALVQGHRTRDGAETKTLLRQALLEPIQGRAMDREKREK